MTLPLLPDTEHVAPLHQVLRQIPQSQSQPGEHVPGTFKSINAYDHYTLFKDCQVQSVGEIPTRGVRLDDSTWRRCSIPFRKGGLGRVKRKWLLECWPADVDMGGMVRGMRCSLGNAAKV